MEEPSLIERARQDPDAFAALYQRYLTPIYRYLFRRHGNVHIAEDLTSQVFTEALEGLMAGHFQPGGCFSAWLFTIARRRSVDHYRQRQLNPLGDPPSAEPGPLAKIENGADLERLEYLISQLDVEKQELLRLRFAAEMSFGEIARLEHRTEGAVKMAFYRLLDWLREHWEAENG